MGPSGARIRARDARPRGDATGGPISPAHMAVHLGGALHPQRHGQGPNSEQHARVRGRSAGGGLRRRRDRGHEQRLAGACEAPGRTVPWGPPAANSGPLVWQAWTKARHELFVSNEAATVALHGQATSAWSHVRPERAVRGSVPAL